MARFAVHHFRSRRAPRARVAGQVVLADVRFRLDDAAEEPSPPRAPRKHAPEEIGGDLDRVAIVEAARQVLQTDHRLNCHACPRSFAS
jgi:hypothetical protein